MQWSITGWTEYMASTRVAGEQGAMRESCKLERAREQEYQSGKKRQRRGNWGSSLNSKAKFSVLASSWSMA